MHACNAVTTDQLLSLRDGEPVASHVPTHAEQCAACSLELTRLRKTQAALRALPQLPPPAYDSATLRAKLVQVQSRRSRSWVGLAAAASVGMIALLLIFASTHTGGNSEMTFVSNVDPRADVVSEETPRIDALVIRSQELESRLQRLPRRPRIERASTAATIGDLQNRIQWVDYQLSLANDVGMTDRQSAALWEDRIELMDTLVKVRYAEAQRFAGSR